MTHPITYSGLCGYHFGIMTQDDLRAVQLTPDGKEWQSPILICTSCRNYLRGYFRYAK